MVNENAEFGTKSRLLNLLLTILESPRRYTKKELMERYGVVLKTITEDFEALRNAGFLLEYDEKYRYFFVEEKPFKKLKELLHFSEEDQLLLYQAIDTIDISQEKGRNLKKKLSSLYDYRRLGHAYLRKPYLTKVDALMLAKEQKKQVILKDYRSSNKIADRLLEVFHVSPPDDTLQAFDVDIEELRHFRISRTRRVVLTSQDWQFQGHQNIMRTDPFRIVDNNQVMVHLRVGLGAYNELTERFPMSKAYLEETDIEGIYDFQCLVNHQFKGLTNFILGYHHQFVEVLEPESLLAHLRAQIGKMRF